MGSSHEDFKSGKFWTRRSRLRFEDESFQPGENDAERIFRINILFI